MSEELTARHVPHGIDALHRGLHGGRDRDEALLHGDAERIEPDPFGARGAPHRHQDLIGLQRFRLALRLYLHGDPGGARCHGLDPDARADGDAATGEEARELRRHFVVLDGQDLGQGFEHRHVGAVRGEDVGELHPDRPRPDDDQGARPHLAPDRTIGRDDLLLVERHAGERLGLGTGGEDDGLALERLRPVHARDFDRVPARQDAHPGVQRDLVLAEEEFDALGHPIGDASRALHGLGIVGAPLRDRDAEFLGAVEEADHLGIAQERLGRDAPPVEADPARPVVLHRGDGETELRAADRGHVAAGPGADDDDVVVLAHRRRVSVPDGRPVMRAGATAPRGAASRPGGSARPWRRPSHGGRRRSSASSAAPRGSRPCPRRAFRRPSPRRG